MYTIIQSTICLVKSHCQQAHYIEERGQYTDHLVDESENGVCFSTFEIQWLADFVPFLSLLGLLLLARHSASDDKGKAEDALIWYPPLAEEGFSPAHYAPAAPDEEACPLLVFHPKPHD